MKWRIVPGQGDMRQGVSMIDFPHPLGAGTSEFDFLLNDAMQRMHMAAYQRSIRPDMHAARFRGPRDAPSVAARTTHRPAWMDPGQLTRNPPPPTSMMNNIWIGQAGTYPGRR